MVEWELDCRVTLPEGREIVCLSADVKSRFAEYVRKYGNGLINSNGGVIYFGLTNSRIVSGITLSRREEDEWRLVVDRTFGSFQPLVSMTNYRLSFIPVCKRGKETSYRVVELKVSIGQIGEIYEDGNLNVYLVDEGVLIGPLYPQEIKELVLLKYKEAVEGAEDARRFMTPCIQKCKDEAKKEARNSKKSDGQAVARDTGEVLGENRSISAGKSSSSVLVVDLTTPTPPPKAGTGDTAEPSIEKQKAGGKHLNGKTTTRHGETDRASTSSALATSSKHDEQTAVSSELAFPRSKENVPKRSEPTRIQRPGLLGSFFGHEQVLSKSGSVERGSSSAGYTSNTYELNRQQTSSHRLLQQRQPLASKTQPARPLVSYEDFF